jgi:thiamine pyrophosphokinase
MTEGTVILADGSFPVHRIPLKILNDAPVIICCDGSVAALERYGLVPWAIVGDMDSLSSELRTKYAGRIYIYDDQDTNDLTKAMMWCQQQGFANITILGATGRREDHTIGNISLLAEYSKYLNVRMVTDTGIFMPFTESCTIPTTAGQQVSLFSLLPDTEITSEGLKYKLQSKKIYSWWEATLNEATGDLVKLKFDRGQVIVFLNFHQSELLP